jgi:hypothetical protein
MLSAQSGNNAAQLAVYLTKMFGSQIMPDIRQHRVIYELYHNIGVVTDPSLDV